MSTTQRLFTNIIGQVTAYGASLTSFIAGISDIVGILSGVAGAALTLALAYGNFKIKGAEAAIKEQQARRMRIENDKYEKDGNTK